MKRLAAAAFLVLCIAAQVHCQQGQALKFRVYYLIKGEKIKKPDIYPAGEVGARNFPLRVKVFLRPSKYYDFGDSSFKKAAASLFPAWSLPAGKTA